MAKKVEPTVDLTYPIVNPKLQQQQAKQNPLPPNMQVNDIILILDQLKSFLLAISKIERNGKFQTVPADDRHRNSFLKVDRFSGIIENFFKNFWSQLKNPTRFRLFSMKENELDTSKNKQAIRDLISGKQTDAVKEFLSKYEIVPKQLQNINNQKSKVMENQTTATGNQQAYRFNDSMINWTELAKFGITKEYLQEKGFLDQILRGYKTKEAIPVSLNLGSAVVRFDARLSLRQSPNGPVLAFNGIRKEPDLGRPYLGHIFSEEDKKNLRENGNMGRTVDLRMRNGEYVKSFVSIDKITNELVAARAESIFIPNEIKGVNLTEEEKQLLQDGKKIYVEGMTSQSGKPFNAYLQVSADKRGVEFLFENDRIFNGQVIGGVELTPGQVQDLNTGKAIFVEDMLRKDGTTFSSFVKLDEVSGHLSFTRYNPDSPEGAREIYVPKELNGALLTPQDRQELREGKTVFIENMISRNGESFSKFVKLDLETGKPMYSDRPDNFSQRAEFKIPAEIWGKRLSATQRANLQDGKTILVDGLVGYDGKSFSQYVRANFDKGHLDYYNENPDRKKDAAQRNVIADKINRQAEQQNNKKSRGRSIS